MTKKISLTPYLFLAPAILIIVVFVLYPIVAVVYYSFTDYSISTPAGMGRPGQLHKINRGSESSGRP